MDRPHGEKVIHCKWVLKRKRNADGDVVKHKARLVICGNFDEDPIKSTFAPVVDFTIVRLLLAIAAQKKWHVHQVDYSNAFLQGYLGPHSVYVSPSDDGR